MALLPRRQIYTVGSNDLPRKTTFHGSPLSHSIFPSYLQGLLWSGIIFQCEIHTHNTIVGHSYQLWLHHKDTFKLSSTVPPLASFLGDPRFTHAYKDSGSFALWLSNNLTTLRSLAIIMKFPSFDSLQSKYKCPPSEFSHYLQLNFFLQNTIH